MGHLDKVSLKLDKKCRFFINGIFQRPVSEVTDQSLEFACDYEMNPPSLGEDFNTILPLCFDFFNVIVVIKELALWTFYEYVCIR